jgi:N-acetyltransferase
LARRLEGELVVLEPLRRDHLGALFEAARPPEIWEFWPFNPATDRRRFEEWLDDALGAVASGSEARFATLDAHTERAIGSTSFCTLRPEHRGLEIGWTWLTPSAWGTGANAEAKLLQLRHAFSELGCQRVEFETDELNVRSRRALGALPAHFEGVLRDLELLSDGRTRSSAIYSILAREWPAVQERLQRRVRAAVRRRSR